MKISFLIHNIFGIGGTNRAVINLATELSHRHEVEIVSAFRRLDRSMFEIPARIELTSLVDTRPGSPDRTDEHQRKRSSIVPPHEEFYSVYSQLTDERMRNYLRHSHRDVYIGSRAALNIYLARWGPTDAVLIAQEHQTHSTLPDPLRFVMQQSYQRLDAAVTVTDADALAFRELTPVAGLNVFSIPNSVPAPELPPSIGNGKLVLAAGRLDEVKRYDVLIRAFRGVVDVASDWGLRIYGAGPESGRLRRLVADLGLNNHVLLMGRQTQLHAEWAKGSIAVSTSDRESFGMSIVEAMRSGLPMVSTRAPVGPEEIITDGVDGLLIPVHDDEAVTVALLSLIHDGARRKEMAAAAIRSSARYDPQVVAGRYEDVFEQLLARKASAVRFPLRTVRGWRKRSTQALQKMTPARPEEQGSRTEAPAGFAGRAFLERSGAIVLELQAVEGDHSAPVEVILRDRADRAREHEMHLPIVAVVPAPPGAGRWQATLPAETALAESRWNLHVTDSLGVSSRLLYSYCDLRHAAEVGSPGSGAFSSRLPYGTHDGFLAIRTWLRDHHAECDSVEVDGASLIVAGRFMWARTSEEPARLTASPRHSANAANAGVSGVSMPPLTGEDFRFAIPVDELASRRSSRHDDWDLYVECPDVVAPIRLSRLADDLVERKAIYQFPSVRCDLPATDLADEWPPPDVRARPYVTVGSDLSIFVREK